MFGLAHTVMNSLEDNTILTVYIHCAAMGCRLGKFTRTSLSCQSCIVRICLLSGLLHKSDFYCWSAQSGCMIQFTVYIPLCKYGLQTLHVHKYQSISCLTRHSFSYHQACLLCTSISSYLHVVGLSRVALQHDLQCAYIVKHRSLEEHFTCYGDHTLTICSVSISCYVGWLPCKLFLQ